MAEAIVGPLLNKLQEVALTQGKALVAVDGEILRLRDKLMWLHALVHETELRSRSDGNKQIRVLACQVREVAFAAEDAVDHFFLEADLSRFGHDWRRATVMFFANFGTQIRVRFVLSRKIKSMNARLEDIADNSSRYGSSSAKEGAATWRASRAIPPVRYNWDGLDLEKSNKPEEKKEVQGGQNEHAGAEVVDEESKKDLEFPLKRKAEKGDLMGRLLDSGRSRVIYVVGESGMGKRYLVKAAYEDPTIKENFAVRIWENFPRDTSEIADQIKNKLEAEWVKLLYDGKDPAKANYLVVIECQMSTTPLGKGIVEKLPNGGIGSKIVLIATSKPNGVKTGVVELHPLDGQRSRTLFNYMMGLKGCRTSGMKTKVMNTVRGRIEEISNHLPLAVVILAKFMRTMDFSKWGAAAEYIMNNNQDNLLNTIVSTSIDDLPEELQSCLLYTAGFPEGSTITGWQLVRLWMAEGFLAQQPGVEPEELGQRYLKELIFRGLLQLVEKKKGDVAAVSVHALVHRFFRSEAQRTDFMDTNSAPVPYRCRRLGFDTRNLPKPDKMKVVKKLRTVLCCSHELEGHAQGAGWPDFKQGFRNLLEYSRFLRVISLAGVDIGEKLPSQIENMLHLQYLGLRCPTLKTLPDSVGNMRKLQTMDVRDTQVEKLPPSLWKIETLRHVYGNSDKVTAGHPNHVKTRAPEDVDESDAQPRTEAATNGPVVTTTPVVTTHHATQEDGVSQGQPAKGVNPKGHQAPQEDGMSQGQPAKGVNQKEPTPHHAPHADGVVRAPLTTSSSEDTEDNSGPNVDGNAPSPGRPKRTTRPKRTIQPKRKFLGEEWVE